MGKPPDILIIPAHWRRLSGLLGKNFLSWVVLHYWGLIFIGHSSDLFNPFLEPFFWLEIFIHGLWVYPNFLQVWPLAIGIL